MNSERPEPARRGITVGRRRPAPSDADPTAVDPTGSGAVPVGAAEPSPPAGVDEAAPDDTMPDETAVDDTTPDELTPDEPTRLDVLLVERGEARSRGQARDLVDAGHVSVDGRPARRASARVRPGAVVTVAATDRYVGRAAHKLVAALDTFADAGLDVTGRRCLDVGACTGGFTQVLLERGARSVDALDVGHGQLAPTVADDPRVTERSGVNLRDVGPGDLGELFDVVVGDLSFISLRLVLPQLAAQLAPGGDAVLLVKPQFEVGRERLGKAGIVRSSPLRLDAVTGVCAAAADVGWRVVDVRPSPLPGGTGNREYLGWFTTADRPVPSPRDLAERIARLDDGIDSARTGSGDESDDAVREDDA